MVITNTNRLVISVQGNYDTSHNIILIVDFFLRFTDKHISQEIVLSKLQSKVLHYTPFFYHYLS
uniref:Uncharacterized protein n=1 Tax=Solanum lycopersicum TaxID=4081 RepID=A0A3Q7HQ01_SOLLC